MLTDIHTHRLPLQPCRAVVNIRVNASDIQIPDAVQTFSAGIHPWDASAPWLPETINRLLTDKRCIAVGEIGLDKLTGPPLPQQQAIFEHQLALSSVHQKPVIIHSVRAQNEVISSLRMFPHTPAVLIHGFSHRTNLAQRWLDEGYYLSFGASLTGRHPALMESLKMTPLNRLFLETDDSGILIAFVYEAAAEALNLPVEELTKAINNNYLTVFSDGKLA